jgi:hypothetical protein
MPPPHPRWGPTYEKTFQPPCLNAIPPNLTIDDLEYIISKLGVIDKKDFIVWMKFTRSYRIPLIPSSTIKIWGLLRLNLFTMRTGSVWTQGIIEGRRIIWRRRATWLKNARSWKRRLFLQTISNQWKSLRRCIWRIPPTLQRQITSESLLVLKARLRRCWRRRRDARFRSGAKAHRRLRRWS